MLVMFLTIKDLFREREEGVTVYRISLCVIPPATPYQMSHVVLRAQSLHVPGMESETNAKKNRNIPQTIYLIVFTVCMDFVVINKKRGGGVGVISNLRLVDGKFPFPFKLGSNRPLQPLMRRRVVLVGWLVGFIINVDILKFFSQCTQSRAFKCIVLVSHSVIVFTCFFLCFYIRAL